MLSRNERLRKEIMREPIPDYLADLVKGPRSKGRVLVRTVSDLIEYCHYIEFLSSK